jgi:hypothetical protein
MKFSLDRSAVQLTAQREVHGFEQRGFSTLIVSDDNVEVRIESYVRCL